jgi:hypothetical protein
MKYTEQKRLEMLRRLEATYSVGGRDALAEMTSLEVHVLHAEKMVDLRATQTHLAQFPHDELGQVRHEKAEREASDIAGYLKAVAEKERKQRGREMEME